MTSQSKRIHMPTPLYNEIKNFTNKPDAPYKTVSETCRKAGELLIKQYQLRSDICLQTEKVTNQ